MKAVVYEKYGAPEVLQIRDVPQPTPRPNEVLVKVHATTVTVGDSRMRSFTVPRSMWLASRLYLGLFRPRFPVLGMELSGVVEAVGGQVSRFQPGERVFASTFNLGFGGHAEYKCLPEDGLIAAMPSNLGFGEAAAAVGGGMTALRCLRRAKIQPGQRVLVYGASGAVGSSAVQLAKNLFGAQVTGVCSSTNLELVRSLGAERVLDYTRQDFTRDGPVYDVVFDAVAKFPPTRAKRALKPGGVYLNVHRDAHAPTDQTPSQELTALKELLEAGIFRPVIDRTYPLEQIVDAHRYVDRGHKRGNVVVEVVK